jgi:hypothetical protein
MNGQRKKKQKPASESKSTSDQVIKQISTRTGCPCRFGCGPTRFKPIKQVKAAAEDFARDV